MANNPNILLQAIQPNTLGAVSQGLQVGQTIRNLPLMNALNQQKLAQSEQSTTQGAQAEGLRKASAVFNTVGDIEISAENYAQSIGALQTMGFDFNEEDQTPTPQNISALNSLRDAGRQVAQQRRGNLAAKRAFEGDFSFRDEEGNIFSQQTFVDPNTQVAKSVLTDITGKGVEPVGKLTAVTRTGESAQEKRTADVTAKGEAAAAVVENTIITESNLSETVAITEADIKLKTNLAAGKASRIASDIEKGAIAADSLVTVNRGLELLESIETGGIQAALLKGGQFLGIEPADEAELNNTLKTAVLQQLRPTFGSAFTEGEGRRLESISQSFGSNTTTNIRLLKQMKQIGERAAQRAIDAAVEAKDFDRAKQIQEAVDFRFDFGDKPTGNVGRFQVEVVN